MNIKHLSIILLLILAWFYWFQLRPAQIRSKCSKSREEVVKSSYGKKPVNIWSQEADFAYEYCLNRNGLTH